MKQFFCLKNPFFCWNLRKFRIFHFFPDFVGSSRRKLYEKWRSAIFFVSDKNCERYLARRWGTSTSGRSTRFPITRLITRCCMSHKFFFELQIYLQNCVWLSYLFPFQKRFAKTGEFRASKAGPCLKGLIRNEKTKGRWLIFGQSIFECKYALVSKQRSFYVSVRTFSRRSTIEGQQPGRSILCTYVRTVIEYTRNLEALSYNRSEEFHSTGASRRNVRNKLRVYILSLVEVRLVGILVCLASRETCCVSREIEKQK